MFGMNGALAIYVIENNGMRMMIDGGIPLTARKVANKMKEFGIFPIHKILLTHSHFDHIQGVQKMKKLMKNTEIEVLASENALENLKNPKLMNDVFKNDMSDTESQPVEDVTPLKDGDIIDLNGLKLKVLNFFGHTMDSIAILDEKNKNIFVGDAIVDTMNNNLYSPPFMPPDFSEPDLLKTFQKLREMKDKLNSISLAHFGVMTENDFQKILEEMEEFYFKAKDSIIKWSKENPSVEYIASKYLETIVPFMLNSDTPMELLQQFAQMLVGWIIEALKISGFIN
jgi:glyoxylase-like metal-dependent hydrolase (beta-lactamase superfamily II)